MALERSPLLAGGWLGLGILDKSWPVLDHHSTKLMQKITSLQHNCLLQTVSSLHIHLDKHDCMEIIILKGQISQIKKTGESILSQKGVKLGKINLICQ